MPRSREIGGAAADFHRLESCSPTAGGRCGWHAGSGCQRVKGGPRSSANIGRKREGVRAETSWAWGFQRGERRETGRAGTAAEVAEKDALGLRKRGKQAARRKGEWAFGPNEGKEDFLFWFWFSFISKLFSKHFKRIWIHFEF
jgi:hypothetical protein